ncbi:hypothetical protein PAXINDRAFT_157643 [Paxillus involutus ATCC 200175]|uniref:Uncharacterized protein n=1 Tax=Paxillus involutus ATCC 200175 TaxID=664439 RepID=A0A0C9T421_PAXIN|nr:hypothetical protein PAXINDRAFT_157643 [Paxillus involutus ATCC 200175]
MPFIDKSNSVQMLGNIAFIAVDGVISDLPNNHYCFNLHVDTPARTKTIIFRICEPGDYNEEVVSDSEGEVEDLIVKVEGLDRDIVLTADGEEVVPDSEGEDEDLTIQVDEDFTIKVEGSDDDDHKFTLNSRQVMAMPCSYHRASTITMRSFDWGRWPFAWIGTRIVLRHVLWGNVNSTKQSSCLHMLPFIWWCLLEMGMPGSPCDDMGSRFLTTHTEFFVFGDILWANADVHVIRMEGSGYERSM